VFSRAGQPAQSPRRPYLLAAIAEPQRFEADLRALAPAVAGTSFFRDHHAFSPADLERVSAKARAAGADAIITTAKDDVRLPADLDLGLPVLVLRIAAAIDDEGVLRARLRAVAGKAS
jgi:tetraacyldisaccharide 4'-kinase